MSGTKGRSGGAGRGQGAKRGSLRADARYIGPLSDEAARTLKILVLRRRSLGGTATRESIAEEWLAAEWEKLDEEYQDEPG